MSDRYLGNIITATPTAPTSFSAPGVWSLDQAGYYQKQGLWPVLSPGLVMWGSNTTGELGQNDTVDRSSPTQVGNQTNWAAAAVGRPTGSAGNISAIKSDGTLWSWGSNAYGNLGLGDQINRSSPVQVGVLTNWKQISVSNTAGTTAATKADGTLWVWGRNSNGQLGQNDTIFRSSPVQVGNQTNWIYCDAVGSQYMIAIKSDGTLWSWGTNLWGQLGQRDVVYRSSPVQIGGLNTWLAISAGSGHVLATKTDNSLWTWGYNTSGGLGQNDTIFRSSPVQIGALTTWLTISANGYSSTAIKTDGTLWSWGSNPQGQLGQNDTISRSSPVQVGVLTDWKRVSVGRQNTLAIKTNGTLWSWGGNGYGQLGQNSIGDTSSPVQVAGIFTWSSVSAGYFAAAAIRS